MIDLFCCERVNPLSDDKISDWSKLKQSAVDNLEFDVNSSKFSKLVENTMGKGEIARYEQFLLFPQCFLNTCFPGTSKGVVVWEWVNLSSPKVFHLVLSEIFSCAKEYRNSPKYSDTLNFRTPIIFGKNNLFFVPNFGQLVKFLSLNFRT